MKTTQVLYEGRVQGVGFRWTARRIAQGFDVCGSVRNLPDGRVELQVSGDKTEVEPFLNEIRESALAGHITAAHSAEIEITAPHRGFQIVP
ncbi:MAG: acylphosphatase [Verrucomicrobiota bacterium]